MEFEIEIKIKKVKDDHKSRIKRTTKKKTKTKKKRSSKGKKKRGKRNPPSVEKKQWIVGVRRSQESKGDSHANRTLSGFINPLGKPGRVQVAIAISQ